MKYNFFKIVGLVLCLNLYQYSYAQNEETENEENLPDKVTHAEPLYIDLIRDLGARKVNENGMLVSDLPIDQILMNILPW